MSAENYCEGIKEILQIMPENVQRCPLCNEMPEDFAGTVNHYLAKHGYKLLHVGTQSSLHENGDVVHDVTAVLGK